MLQDLLDWLRIGYLNIIEFFNWLVDFFVDLLDNIGDACLSAMKALAGWSFEVVEPVLEDVADAVPDLNSMMASSRPVFRQALYVCDRMFALSEGITIVLLFIAFVWTFILVKMALKLFPTIG